MENLSQLLSRYRRRPDSRLAEEILTALAASQVYVPVNLNRNPEAPTEGEAFGLRPDTIPGPGGRVIFPAFSNQGQIPNDYGARFTFLHLPFGQFCASACADPRFGGLVLDPFTAKFMLPEEVCRSFSNPAREEQ